MSRQSTQPKIGDVFLMRFSGANEQRGLRPGVVFQNNIGNEFSPNIIALPMTSRIKKTAQPTHVIIPVDGTGLFKTSMVLCENPERMSKENIGDYITTLPDSYMRLIAEASLLASSVISFLEPDYLLSVWQKAILLNSAG